MADLLVHPHEKPVSIGDTLGWYRRAGFEIMGSDPSLSARDYPGLGWMSGRVPSKIQNLAIELRWLSWNADYYVVAGRRAS